MSGRKALKGHFFLYRLAEAAAERLPKKTAYRFGDSIAFLYGLTARKDVESVAANLSAALGPSVTKKELRSKSRRVIRNYARYLVDLFYSAEITREAVKKQFELIGLERLAAARAEGRGVILVSAHVGNWEIGGMALAALGHPICGLALRHTDSRVDAMFARRRMRPGLRVVAADGYLRECFRVLRRNEVLALNADRLYGEKGVPVRFFEREVQFPSGFARLALATGAPALPVFIFAREDDRHQILIGDRLKAAVEKDLVAEFAAVAENEIRRVPLQWFVFQKFWETAEWPA